MRSQRCAGPWARRGGRARDDRKRRGARLAGRGRVWMRWRRRARGRGPRARRRARRCASRSPVGVPAVSSLSQNGAGDRLVVSVTQARTAALSVPTVEHRCNSASAWRNVPSQRARPPAPPLRAGTPWSVPPGRSRSRPPLADRRSCWVTARHPLCRAACRSSSQTGSMQCCASRALNAVSVCLCAEVQKFGRPRSQWLEGVPVTGSGVCGEVCGMS